MSFIEPDLSWLMPTMFLVVSNIIWVTVFLVHEFIVMPPVARRMRKAKWSKCSPGFVQDDAGRVHFVINDIELPEGVVHNKRGWFLRSRPPFVRKESVDVAVVQDLDAIAKSLFEQGVPEDQVKQLIEGMRASNEALKPKRGRPPKENAEDSDETQNKALETILETPVLEGLGKSVFFGYDGAPLVANLKTMAHANLRVMKEIIPATISRTQLGNLYRWAVQKGYEKRGGEQTKIIILALACVVVIASLGIVAYMLTQKPAA